MDLDDITMEHVFYFIMIMLGLAVISLLFAYIVNKSKENENSKLPIQTMKAKLIDIKRQTDLGIDSIIFQLFETEDGNRVQLTMNTDKYLVVGDSGTLTWQGKKLISFDRNQ